MQSNSRSAAKGEVSLSLSLSPTMVRAKSGNGGKSDNREGPVVGRHFFKVLIGDFQSKLYIPPAFARRIVDDESNRATLNSSTGRYQDIEVCKDNYSMFFQSGWQSFVEAHSLQCGEFLVFKYHGDLQFYVKIFGRSGCERFCGPTFSDDKDFNVYQLKRAPLSDVHRHREVPKSIHNRESLRGRNLRLRKSSDSYERPVEKAGENLCEPASFHGDELKGHNLSKIKRERSCDTDTTLEVSCPHFVIKMTPTGFQKSWLHVPVDFVSKSVFITEGPVTVLDANNRSWPFLLRRNLNRSMLCKGWSTFRRKQRLGLGDTCIFKSVEGTNDVLDVVILKK